MTALILAPIQSLTVGKKSYLTPPQVANAGTAAEFAWEEWLCGVVRNNYTRKAYAKAVRRCALIDAQNVS
jgi:hypothetical protein